MELLASILNAFTSLGATVVLPFIMFFLGLIFRLGFSKSFKSALTIGIGFIGINLIIGYFWGAVSPVAIAFSEMTGNRLSMLDIGWPAAAAVAWGSIAAPVIVIGALVVNFVMIKLKWTKTLNVDIWNFWGPMLYGQIVISHTKSLIAGIITAIAILVILNLLADRTQKHMYDYYQIPGVTIPHLFSQSAGIVAYPVNYLLDRIPGINSINWTPQNIKQKLGVFGEPMSIGLILGAAMAIIAGFDYRGILTTSLGLAGSMVLLPKMVAILMEGLVPFANGVSSYMTEKLDGHEVYIGMDTAIMLGDPANLVTAVLLIPITILIALILPGNKALPMADLPALVYMTVIGVGLTKGNVFRSVIIGIPIVIALLWTATYLGPEITTLAGEVGFDVPEGAVTITSIATGSSWIGVAVQKVMDIIAGIF